MNKTNPSVILLPVFSFAFFLTLVSSGKLYSQNKFEEFKLSYSKKIISNGNYSVINYLDSRNDTADLGFVYSGLENKKMPVLAKPDFKTQLRSFVKNSIDSSTADGEILFQLRKLKFIEKTEPGTQTGICLLRADIYVRQDSTYKRLSRLDTIVLAEAAEVTKQLFDATSAAITKYIIKNLDLNFSNTENFTYSQVVHMDDLEKSRIKLYNSKEFVNGLYKTYESFKNQAPDYKIIEANYKDKNLIAVKAENAKGKKTKLRPNEFYAFVTEGKPFISAEYGCYMLEKKDGDLYFIGEGRIPPEKAINYDAENGAETKETALVITIPQTAFYLIKIDHVDGSLMRIKEIKN